MTSSVGIGFAGGHLGVGGAQSASHSITRTDLARKYLMPKQPSNGAELMAFAALFGLLSWYFFVDSRIGLGVLFLAGAGALLLVFFGGQNSRAREIQAWRDRRAYLAEAWICHRCGTDYIPS
jgi:hypothetical protein